MADDIGMEMCVKGWWTQSCLQMIVMIAEMRLTKTVEYAI